MWCPVGLLLSVNCVRLRGVVRNITSRLARLQFESHFKASLGQLSVLQWFSFLGDSYWF